MAIRPIGAALLPATTRPPLAAATSPAVSVNEVTAYDTFDPARRCASAARAISTSSNGNVRSPITWYFS